MASFLVVVASVVFFVKSSLFSRVLASSMPLSVRFYSLTCPHFFSNWCVNSVCLFDVAKIRRLHCAFRMFCQLFFLLSLSPQRLLITPHVFSVILVISHLVIFDFTLCIFAHYNNKKYFFIIIVADLGCPKMILTK